MPITPGDIGCWSQQLSDRDVQVRREAARRLMEAGEASVASALALIVAVGDHDEVVANLASEALENLGSPRVQDASEIARCLDAGKPDSAYWAATLLGRLGDQAAPAVKSLATAVASHAGGAVRERAAWALGQIGPAARSAREVLREAIHSGSPRLARLAQESLEQIDTAAAPPK